MQAEGRSAERAKAGSALMDELQCAGAGQQTYMPWGRACTPLSLGASPSMPPQCSSYSRWSSMSPCASPLNPRSHMSSGICSSGCWRRFLFHPLLSTCLPICLSVRPSVCLSVCAHLPVCTLAFCFCCCCPTDLLALHRVRGCTINPCCCQQQSDSMHTVCHGKLLQASC